MVSNKGLNVNNRNNMRSQTLLTLSLCMTILTKKYFLLKLSQKKSCVKFDAFSRRNGLFFSSKTRNWEAKVLITYSHFFRCTGCCFSLLAKFYYHNNTASVYFLKIYTYFNTILAQLYHQINAIPWKNIVQSKFLHRFWNRTCRTKDYIQICGL